METIIKVIGILLALYIVWEILRLFIWDIWEGRITRSAFILITLVFFSPILLMVFQPNLIDSEIVTKMWTGLIGLYILNPLVYNIVLLFVSSNIMAKRFRDTGAEGWTLTIIWTLIIAFVPEEIGAIISFLVIAYLFVVPSSR